MEGHLSAGPQKADKDTENNKKKQEHPESYIETDAIHVGQEPERWPGQAVVPPISMATTFKQLEPGKPVLYEYSRCGNPTRQCLEECLASLEKAKYALTFSSGLGATTTLMFLLKSGDHIVSIDDVYGGTGRLFRRCMAQMGVESSFVDMSTDPSTIVKHLKPETRLVWIETPTNPLLKLADIERISTLVHEYDPKILVLVDNTFATSYYQRPLLLGADLVLHSLTKYMNGHSDVVMGCLMMNNEELYKQLSFLQYAIGAVPSPFDCYLVNRGLKTLAVRMRQHMTSALQIANYLEKHKHIERVIYPPLASYPQHDLYKKQMSGFSGMISLYLKGDEVEKSQKFLKHLKLFTTAESLGGYESLIELPAIMTHASVPEEHRRQLGITDGLIRISVGLEDVRDLIDDIESALEYAFSKSN
jgi:cystathionine gamma-lyase